MDTMVFRDLTYGMFAIGATEDGKDKGCIVNTVIQVTAEDPIVLMSMSKDNYTCGVIEKTKLFSVSILSEQVDNNVIAQLGFSSGKDKDKFTLFETAHTPEGLPIVAKEAVGYLTCQVLHRVDAETHCVILARVKDAFKGDGARPMTYAYYHNERKGKAPKNAPTYQKEAAAPEKKKEEKKQSVCTVCGYVYDGPLSQMPEAFLCPICSNGKPYFVEK